MKKIYIVEDEAYPVYYFYDLAKDPTRDISFECTAEVDDETFERWASAVEEYAQVQFEIRQKEEEFYNAQEKQRNKK